MIDSVIDHVADVERTVQGLRQGILRAHEVHADEERLPLQVFRLSRKLHTFSVFALIISKREREFKWTRRERTHSSGLAHIQLLYT